MAAMEQGMVALALLQAGLIFLLLVERRRRVRAQGLLAERLRMERLVAEVSTSLANLPLEQVEDQIQQGLRRVGEALGAERCELWRYSEDRRKIYFAHGWRQQEVPASPLAFSLADYPLILEYMQRGEGLAFSRPEQLPTHLLREGTSLQQLGARSLVAIPVASSGPPIGALTLSTTLHEQDWPQEIVHVLRPLGELFFGVLLRKQAELEARQARQAQLHLERVSALGELAASIAHELNQPLAAILTNAESAQWLLARTPVDTEQLREILQDIVTDDTRAGEVIRRMRTLLKKGELKFAQHDLNDLVREVAHLVGNDARLRGASITLELAEQPLWVVGDGVQLQQVVLNLVVNALDAVARRPAGERSVWVRTAQAEEKVELVVEDTGEGLTADMLEQVFEPFFTTKREGLGMGLAISRSILEVHRGRLRAEVRLEGGARFRCTLPLDRAA